MNMLAKDLKKRRDAEERLRNSNPPVQFISTLDDDGNEIQEYKSVEETATKGELAAFKNYEPLAYNGELLFSPDGDILMGVIS